MNVWVLEIAFANKMFGTYKYITIYKVVLGAWIRGRFFKRFKERKKIDAATTKKRKQNKKMLLVGWRKKLIVKITNW